MKVLSYNIRGPGADAGAPAAVRYVNRREHVVAAIKLHAPDVFGLQATSSRLDENDSVTHSAPWLVDQFKAKCGDFRPAGDSPKMIFFDKAPFGIATDAAGVQRAGEVVGGCASTDR